MLGYSVMENKTAEDSEIGEGGCEQYVILSRMALVGLAEKATFK